MKVLYIGHYKESSGWANAAIQNILALDSAGVDVVCRDIKLTNKPFELPEKIAQLERKSIDGVTDCIQHVLPHHLSGTKKLAGKNIAHYVAESMFSKKNSWHTFLDQMDEVWVPNDTLNENTSKFVKPPVKTVPYAFDLSIYKNNYNILDLYDLNSTFKFYTIADLNSRKNIESIIRCYYHTFKNKDNVLLIIKAYKYGLNSDDLQRYLIDLCNKIQSEMRLFKNLANYPTIKFLTERIDSSLIYSLHKTCDCFVGISRGEGWSIPAFDAMCFGNKPICSKEGGPAMFIDPNNNLSGYLVEGQYDICNQADGAFDHIFTGSEFWFTPSEQKTCEAMRESYENRKKHESPWELGQKYSYEKIGQTMKDLLK